MLVPRCFGKCSVAVGRRECQFGRLTLVRRLRAGCVLIKRARSLLFSLINVVARTQLCADVALTGSDVVCDASSVYLRISKEFKAFATSFANLAACVSR